MFRIDISAMKRCSKQFHSDAESLLKNQRRVREVCDDLSSLGHMSQILETLEYITMELGKEAGNVDTFSEAAERIAFKYESAETRVLEVAESTSGDLPKGNVKFGNYSNTQDMDPGVRDTLGDIDKLIN